MTQWLIRRFIHQPGDVKDIDVRTAYGMLASITGVVVNLLLAGCKFVLGILSGSLAISADAANNLSDAAGSIATFVSVRVAKKPLDKEHPFGHGRMEYLGALVVGALIFMMSLGLLQEGVTKIFAPQSLTISWTALFVLAFSIVIKAWLYTHYQTIGQRIDNSAVLAAAKDSFNDVLATSAIVISLLLHQLFDWQVDGYMGILVALLVFKAGFDVCRDTVDRLLGCKPDPETIQNIHQLMLSYDGILGIHDLVVHDYGPGRRIASVHAEVSDQANIVAIHEVIDRAERDIAKKLHLEICIHMDPIATQNQTVNNARAAMYQALLEIDDRLTMHDFRMTDGEECINLIFDCVLPPSYDHQAELLEKLSKRAKEIDPRYCLVVQFDTDFT